MTLVSPMDWPEPNFQSTTVFEGLTEDGLALLTAPAQRGNTTLNSPASTLNSPVSSFSQTNSGASPLVNALGKPKVMWKSMKALPETTPWQNENQTSGEKKEEWEEHLTEEGTKYYYNKREGRSTWYPSQKQFLYRL